MGEVAVSVSKRFKFSAAHYLPDDPGLCRNLHGHTYDVEVTATGPVDDETSMVIHFDELKDVWNRLEPALDHQLLNDTLPMEALPPTTENLAAWLLTELHDLDARIIRVDVYEGPGSKAVARLVGVA